jgi:site-specific DNA recombinase
MITQAKRLKSDSIPVVLYLRMSSDKQDKSIDGQREELLAYCVSKNYTVVREYSDEGVSGWKSRERGGFMRLIADAADGDFKLVICWDQSRFSRFTPMQVNVYWQQLSEAGVEIETIKEGRLDLQSLGGWLTASVQQHAKAEYSKSLGKDVVRGMKREWLKGRWLGKPPYGYKVHRTLNDSSQVIDTKLMVDEEKAAIVRRVFQMRAQGKGYLTITTILNKEGIKPATSDHWNLVQVKLMLRRQTYLGHTVLGAKAGGQFAKAFDQVTTLKNTHPAIIDASTWDKVQALNATKSKRRGNGPGEGAALAGILFCGDCGAPLYSWPHRNRYVCSSYLCRGVSVCRFNWVQQDVMLRVVANKIREELLLGSQENLTAAIEKVLANRKAVPKMDVAAIRKQIAGIDRKLEQAAERIMDVDASLVKAMEAKMLDLQAQREALEAKLEIIPATKKQPTAKAIAAQLWALDEVLRKGSPATIRQALSQLVNRIELNFVDGIQGKRVTNKVSGGCICCINSAISPGRSR